MTELLTDWAVLGSVVAALVLSALSALARRRLPAWTVYGPAMALAVALAVHRASFEADRYRRWPMANAAPGPVAALALGVAAVAGAALWGRRHPGASAGLSLVVAGAGLGIFLCVPETGLLRLIFGPLLVAGAAAWLGRLRPFGPLEALLLAASLAWIAALDGQTRGSGIVGASACLMTAALMPLGWPDRPTPKALDWPDRPAPQALGWPDRPAPNALDWPDQPAVLAMAVVAATILACSRLAGIVSSTALALALAGLSLTAGAAGLWWGRRRRWSIR